MQAIFLGLVKGMRTLLEILFPVFFEFFAVASSVFQSVSVSAPCSATHIPKGDMSRRALALVLEWAVLHRVELRQAWDLASHNQEPSKIPPLE